MRRTWWARLMVMAAASVTAGCAKTPGDYRTRPPDPELLHTAVRRLNDVIVYDIFNPPQASRVYAYATIAAYEALRPAYPGQRTLAGQLNGLAPLPQPQPGAEHYLPRASIHAFMTVGRGLTFSRERMDSLRSGLEERIRAMGVSAAVFERSVAFGDTVAKHILAWAAADHYLQTRGYPKYTVTTAAGRWQPTPPAYMDAVEPGRSQQVDSLVVVWPDRRYQVLTNVAADQMITLSQQDAAGRYAYQQGTAVPPLFADVTARLGIDVKHEENTFYDYTREPLMPHRLSTEGPALATGDVNGDGLDDIYVGGAKWQAGRLLIQRPDGGFRPSSQPAFRADSLYEDVSAVFFDANGDGHPDLFVVSGGNEFWDDAEALRDRLYLNDGRGSFHRAEHAFPDFFDNGSCVVPGDFNGDGHPDLFVGSRVVARRYGLTPRSHLLQNDGTGRFSDVTLAQAPGLAEAGMVSSAAWIDYDNDGRLDLIVVGEWMPVRVFRQENGRFVDRTAAAGLSGTNGWWNHVSAVDLNEDGRQDLVLGNLGLNSYVHASPGEPARLYVHDFFGNGTLEQILTFYKRGVSYPLAGRDELVRMMPQLRSRYPSYASFGASRIEDILPASELRQASVLEAREFASAVALNRGDGRFDLRPLPMEAQFAPVYASLAEDFDGDGHTDLLVAGNFYGVTPVQGRYDASYGLLLRGDGTGRFETVDLESSHLVIEGQVRHMALLRQADGGRAIVVARNDDRLQILRPLRVRPSLKRSPS
ncbi:MAG: FG-GAP-like repeat-containing protein [Dehalococcoidia bacterium]|nr:FG-GAP-like repeat-containing protein [Dehalococcoidia bacterium]